MRSGILRLVGACAAALAIASPVSAMNLSLTESSSGALGIAVLDTLAVSLSGLGGQIVTGYDLYISYDTLAPSDILSVSGSDALFVTTSRPPTTPTWFVTGSILGG